VKESLRVAVVQGQTFSIKQKQSNLNAALRTIKKLGRKHDLVVFPELSLTGYGGDPATGSYRKLLWNQAEQIPGISTRKIGRVASKTGTYVAFGMAERSRLPFAVYNAAVLVGPEGYVGHTRKVHLVGEDDSAYTRGNEINAIKTSIGTFGMLVCYDMWFPEASRLLALDGAELIIILSSSFTGGSAGGIGSTKSKRLMWDLLPRAIALNNLVHVVACNGAGKVFMGERLGYWERLGRSKIIDALGEIVSNTTSNRDTVVKGVLKQDTLEQARTLYSLFRDRVPQTYRRITE